MMRWCSFSFLLHASGLSLLLHIKVVSPFVPRSSGLRPPSKAKLSAAKTDVSKVPVVVCPGFGNDAIDYSDPLEQGREKGFVTALVKRGFDPELISVLPLKRYEWARVAGGLLELDFYLGTAKPTGLGYGWYVRRLRQTIQEAYEKAGGERVVLIGHSAGGWLGRAALGDGSWDVDSDDTTDSNERVRSSDRVRALFTIGAIHQTPQDESTCVTRGVLKTVAELYPGAFLASEGITYVSVGGDAVVGRPKVEAGEDDAKLGSPESNEAYRARGEGSTASVAYTSYSAVSGDGLMTGDGVVPLEWTLLDGSKQIVLDDVVHSINEAGTTIPTDKWYGSDKVVDRWLNDALEEAGIRTTNGKTEPFGMLGNLFASRDDESSPLRRLMLAAPALLLPATKARAAETPSEAIRLLSSKTLPGLGPPDVYYPPYFVGRWKVTRVISSSDDLPWTDLKDNGVELPISISCEARFVPYNAGKDFTDFDNQSNDIPAIADRSFNEKALNSALAEEISKLFSTKEPVIPTVRSIDWTATNPNVLSISYADGASKEVKVTKRSSDVSGDGNGVFSSEFRRITDVPAASNGVGGIPSILKSRVLTKWKPGNSSKTAIEGIEITYNERGMLRAGLDSLGSLTSSGPSNQEDWRSTKTKILMERIS
mmetsp:Transcript_35588/g.81360  ORF Transcript_35588/g.81360 Transcript_35588/m.81360 type:complete len:653 (+) Transcript_35588:126-2084(+)